MLINMAELVIHVGYPKTATTTFQRYVFPEHPEIEYLGKFIPSFRYIEPVLWPELDSLIREDETRYRGVSGLQEILAKYKDNSKHKVVMISSESFVDGWAIDRGVVARRLKEACGECKIIFTLREQISAIKSFYSAHGRFGHNLFLSKTELEKAKFPMSLDNWLDYCFRMFDKNFPGILLYSDTINYYKKLFGQKNVGVFLYEEFCADRKSYINKFCKFIGVDPNIMQGLLKDNHENPNISAPELLIYRICLTLGIKPRLNRIDGNYSKLTKLLSSKYGKSRLDLSDEWYNRLQKIYAPGNSDLVGQAGLPLDKYHYQIL